MSQNPSPDDDAVPAPEPVQGTQFPIVGVGASAGGLEAFTQFLRALPLDTGMAFVLVQHLSPTHDSALAQILSRATRMPVTEVHDEPVVEPNHVYVIPPNRCMGIAGGILQLAPREKAGHTRVVDHFFRALAEERRHQAIGIVLSGNASDGTLGLEAIKAEGGITFAQDDSAQFDGMPHSAVASGCVDLVMSPEQIAQEVARIARHPYAVPDSSTREHDGSPKLDHVLQLLHLVTGVDFSQYKFNTVYRRVTRRMLLQKQNDLNAYASFLQQNPDEIAALYRDILINVTSFFRNPDAFEALKEQVFPRLLENRARHEPVRIWTLGCSTGQEAYSVAMAFTEFAEAQGSTVPLQIFATDLSEACIDTARLGIYSKDIAQDVSPERLRRFFVEVDGRYRITRTIRDTCVFSRHNMLADPPFSRLDLVTCRNLLIYLEPVLQQRIVPTLHYALKPSGFLWLGTSETIGGFRNLFEPLDAKQKIYARNPGARGMHHSAQHSAAPRAAFVPITSRTAAPPALDLHREADRLLLTRFAPPSVLVSADFDILQYRGDTSPYLAPAPGKATLHLPKMLREGLLVGVRAALLRAGNEGKPMREEGLRVKSHDGWRDVSVEVVPLNDGNIQGGGGFLVLFDEPDRLPPVGDHPTNPDNAQLDSITLTRELAATRDYLQSVIDQQEAANEELQSSNEEIQSANEELQSINEELETSKEEIQSSNEELATVNDELNSRNIDLNRLNNDLTNVFASVQIPIVLIGIDLCVRRFTPAAEKLFDLMPSDIGRPMARIRSKHIELPDIESLLAEVLDTVSNREVEARDKHGHRYVVRLRPYRTLDNHIDGVVLMLMDVEHLKRAHERTENIIATVREPLLLLDGDLRVQMASGSFYRHFGVNRDETDGRLVFELGNGQWNIAGLRQLLDQVSVSDTEFNDYEVQHTFEHMGQRTMLLNARRLLQLDDRRPTLILLAIEDVTERKKVQGDVAQLASIVNSSKDAIISKNLDGVIQSWNQGAQNLFGYTAAEAIGQPIGILIPDDHLDEEPRILERIRAGEAIEHYETVRKRKDGSLLDISLTVSPMHDVSGRIVGASKVARDITGPKRADAALRVSEERLRTLADNMAQFAWTADPKGSIYWFNQRWYDYTGTSPDEMQGGGWHKVLHPDHADRVVTRIQHSWDTGEIWEDTFPLRAKDGTWRWFLSRALPIRDADGQVQRWFGTHTDVTEQREMAEELHLSALQLADADRHKNEFLAMLAHEMRNPLGPIRNALQIMRRSDGSGELTQSAIAVMERQVAQMVRLVDDLLDVNRISRGKIELRSEPVDLATIVQQAVEIARPVCDHKGVGLTVVLPSQPLVLDVDPIRLAQVLGNLMHNACKFTDKGGDTWIEVERDGAEVVIRVRDSGIGIAAEQLPHIFDMFTQADTSLERASSGLGIGLSLVKSLVELHGGTVRATSAGKGQGSEFVVRLPIVAGLIASAAEPASVVDTAGTLSRRILVVDDNLDAAESLSQLLQLSGHETRLAHDGMGAVELAATFRPDLVLLDIGLPKLNGYDAAKKMREQPGGGETVLVALTGWGHDADRQKSSQAGFDKHLVKPVHPDVLMKLIADLPVRG